MDQKAGEAYKTDKQNLKKSRLVSKHTVVTLNIVIYCMYAPSKLKF